MASVIKRPQSGYWYACCADQQGRQLKRSTKTSDRRKALQIAIELERVEMQSLTTTQLRKIPSDVSEKVNGDNLSVPTIEAYLKDWLKLIGARIKPATLIRYDGTVTKFLAHMGARARQAVTSLTPRISNGS